MSKTNFEGWKAVLANPPKELEWWLLAEREYLLKRIKQESFVLEVGCGDGRSIFDVLQANPAKVIGIDKDDSAVNLASERFRYDLRVRIESDDGEGMRQSSSHFDYVTCIGTFANLGISKFRVLDEMKRVLRPEGQILVSVYADNALPTRLAMYERAGLPVKRVYKDGTVIVNYEGGEVISEQFSRAQLEHIFGLARLKVNDITPASIGHLCTLSKI